MSSIIVGAIGTLISALFSSNSVKDTLKSGFDSWWSARNQALQYERESNQRIKEATSNATIKRIELDQRQYADADNNAIDKWDKSIVDDVLVYSLVILIFSCFIPHLQPFTETGIRLLNEMPFWIQAVICGTYASVLGLRFLFLAPLQVLFGRKALVMNEEEIRKQR